MKVEIKEMRRADYEAALALWQRCEGIGLSDADEEPALTRFLNANQGLCLAGWDEEALVATCLCGSDGRRGYLYHLAVDPQYRRMGIGMSMVNQVFERLAKLEIHKCHIMVYADNESGLAFWKQCGWATRPEIVLMSKSVCGGNHDVPC